MIPTYASDSCSSESTDRNTTSNLDSSLYFTNIHSFFIDSSLMYLSASVITEHSLCPMHPGEYLLNRYFFSSAMQSQTFSLQAKSILFSDDSFILFSSEATTWSSYSYIFSSYPGTMQMVNKSIVNACVYRHI